MNESAAFVSEAQAMTRFRPEPRQRGQLFSNLHSKLLWLTVWLLIMGFSLWWRTPNLASFGLSNDEGAHVMWAKLSANGYPLYEETRAVQAPLFIEAIGLSFRLFNPTVETARWLIMLNFFILAMALSWLAYQSSGWGGAIGALILVSVAPLLFKHSRLVMAEIPATTLAVLSTLLLFVYLNKPLNLNKPRRRWLFLSGLCLGLSFITKALYPFLILLLGGLLICHLIVSVWPHRFHFHLLGWGLVIGSPILLVGLSYNLSDLYEQLVLFRNQLRVAIPGSATATYQQFKLFVTNYWGLWLLAMPTMFGLFIDSLKQLKSTKNQPYSLRLIQLYASPRLFWLGWLIAGSLMLSWHAPLFPHHFIILLPPLIILASDSFSFLTHIKHNPVQSTLWTSFANFLLIGVAMLNLPSMVSANQETAAIVTGGREAEALTFLQAVSHPTDFVMGDSQLLIFMAERQTPPPLGDVALVAIKAGLQSSERMIDLTEQYQAPAVVKWSLRLPWLPDYLTWTENNYLAQRVWDNDHIIYYVPRISTDQPLPNSQVSKLGADISLHGYQVEPLMPGATQLNLKLYWQTSASLEKNYTIFTQLLDTNGQFVTGWDSQPLGGHFPTSQWPTDEIVTDIVQFPLPSDLTSGEYRLITGMYQLETLERLTTPTGQDYLSLTRIETENLGVQ